MILPPHEGDAEGDTEVLGSNEELGKELGKLVNVGGAVGVFELLGTIDGIT